MRDGWKSWDGGPRSSKLVFSTRRKRECLWDDGVDGSEETVRWPIPPIGLNDPIPLFRADAEVTC